MRRYTPAGYLIRKARLESGLTQQQVSDATGISVPRISEYENGRRDPTVDTLLRLLAATDHTVRLVGAAESDFANPHVNARKLEDVLDLVDAVARARSEEDWSTV